MNQALLDTLNPDEVVVEIVKLKDAELDEVWSFVEGKENQHWLLHAINHRAGGVFAYVFGDRKDKIFVKLKELLEPFGIKRFYTDGWGTYECHLEPEEHEVGKQNTQNVERKHLTLRTQIKRLV